MVVENHKICSVELKGSAGDIPRVDTGLTEAAAEQFFNTNKALAAIEEGSPEDLMRAARQVGNEPGGQRHRIWQRIAQGRAFGRPASCLGRRTQNGDFRWAHSNNAEQLRGRGSQNGCEPTKSFKQVVSKL